MGLGDAVGGEPFNCYKLLFTGNVLTVFHILDQGLINCSLGDKCGLLPGQIRPHPYLYIESMAAFSETETGP